MKIRTIDLRFSLTEDPQEINTLKNSDSDSEDESVFKKLNLDKIKQACDSNKNNIIEIRDSLFARKDDIVIFVIQDGQPYDDGSHLLAKDNKILQIKDTTLMIASHKIMVQISYIPNSKNQFPLFWEKKTLKEALRSLYDVTLELSLQIISVSKTDVNNVA